MIKIIYIAFLLIFSSITAFAQPVAQPVKVVIFLTEQNIDNSKFSWWINEMDFSVSEKEIANKLQEEGFQVISPADLLDTYKKEKNLKIHNGFDGLFLKLASNVDAKIVIIGQAVVALSKTSVNTGTNICFASVTAKILKVEKGQLIGFVESSSSASNSDIDTASKDALSKAINIFNLRMLEKVKPLFKIEDQKEDIKVNESILSNEILDGNLTGNETKI